MYCNTIKLGYERINPFKQYLLISEQTEGGDEGKSGGRGGKGGRGGRGGGGRGRKRFTKDENGSEYRFAEELDLVLMFNWIVPTHWDPISSKFCN